MNFTPLPPQPAGQKKQRILVVEDEAYLRDVYCDILRDAGFEVDTAHDGEQAMGQLKKGGYDAVLLDIMLPKIDGIEVLRNLKQTAPDKPNGPVIILSNLEQQTIISQGVALGARAYIIKSNINPEDLVTELKKILSTEQ